MGSAGTILVVDDDPMLWEAPEAALAARRFNLILLDHHLSDFPGRSVLRSLHHFTPSTPVLLMTGFGTEDFDPQSFHCATRLRGTPELPPASIGKKGSVC